MVMLTRRAPCEDEGRDQHDGCVSQGKAKTASRPPAAGTEAGTDSSSQPQREASLPASQAPDLQHRETVDCC